MFHIKFCVKCNWNFGGFLMIHITFYKHISSINNENDAQKKYLSTELLKNLLAAFFVEKTRFLPIFFQIQNLGWGYTREKLKLETKVSFCIHFWRYLDEKLIFWNKLNWIRESSMRSMKWIFKKMLFYLINILKSTTEMPKK